MFWEHLVVPAGKQREVAVERENWMCTPTTKIRGRKLLVELDVQTISQKLHVTFYVFLDAYIINECVIYSFLEVRTVDYSCTAY